MCVIQTNMLLEVRVGSRACIYRNLFVAKINDCLFALFYIACIKLYLVYYMRMLNTYW